MEPGMLRTAENKKKVKFSDDLIKDSSDYIHEENAKDWYITHNKSTNMDEKYNYLLNKYNELEKKIANLEDIISNKVKNEKNNEKLCIIIENYKRSILVKNMYNDKFTTVGYKEKLKQLGGKWTKNDTITGWIFLGKNKDNNLEKSAQFIIKEFEGPNFEYTINEI